MKGFLGAVLVALLGALTVVANACGNEDVSGSSDRSTDGGLIDDGDDGRVDVSSPADAGCPGQGFVGEVSRSNQGDHEAVAFGTEEVVTELVVAARLTEGGFYTIYVSDHPYVGEPRDFDTIEAAPGGALATLSFGLQGGYVEGESFAPGDEGATVAVIVDSGGGASATTTGATGTVTPLGWNHGWVCFDIDYRDDLQSVVGTVSARVVSGF